jgi:hypothetical protein
LKRHCVGVLYTDQLSFYRWKYSLICMRSLSGFGVLCLHSDCLILYRNAEICIRQASSCRRVSSLRMLSAVCLCVVRYQLIVSMECVYDSSQLALLPRIHLCVIAMQACIWPPHACRLLLGSLLSLTVVACWFLGSVRLCPSTRCTYQPPIHIPIRLLRHSMRN